MKTDVAKIVGCLAFGQVDLRSLANEALVEQLR